KLPSGCILTSIEEDTVRKIDNPPFSVTSESFSFLQCNIYGDFGRRYNRIAIWASNQGLAVLCMESSMFIDEPFRVTSAPFLQCKIIMGFDPTSNIYTLMSAKDEYLYYEVLHSIIISLKYPLSLKLVVMDFEKALLNA
ncbi:hypothetical protein MXB_5504, partial [Myxobolus squamalis]